MFFLHLLWMNSLQQKLPGIPIAFLFLQTKQIKSASEFGRLSRYFLLADLLTLFFKHKKIYIHYT